MILPTIFSKAKRGKMRKEPESPTEEAVSVLSSAPQSANPPETQKVEEEGGVTLNISDTTSSSSSNKRKRDVESAPELEIDVNLPEPPSKKAMRKAKKQNNTSLTFKIGSPDETVFNDSSQAGKSTIHINVPDDKSNSEPRPSAQRSVYGIWIGNLPFAATKQLVRDFFTSNAPGIILDSHITRINMPAPTNAKATRTQIKPLNKGFAYVDFTTQAAMTAAMKLSETSLGGRNILIKSSKSFEGRPDKTVIGTGESDKGNVGKGKIPTKRVFVGNLGFDVTVTDLREHFETCGMVADVHVATFEDSGKCKGYAWVTFEEIEAAEAAVRGWTRRDVDEQDMEEQTGYRTKKGEDKDHDMGGDSGEEVESNTKKKNKPRKWFVNRLQGRAIRCEFAEDATVRYKKRFGKEGKLQSNSVESIATSDRLPEEANLNRVVVKKDKNTRNGIRPGATTDPALRRGRNAYGDGFNGMVVKDERTGAAAPDKRYRTGVIIESAGTKITF